MKSDVQILRLHPEPAVDLDVRDDEVVPPPAEVRALHGEREGWATLIDRHSHTVLLSLLAKGVPPERARELVQETWLRLIERQRAGRLAKLTLPGLAIVQAGFLAATDWRRAGVRREAPPAAAEAAPERADDLLIRREELERVRRALAACSPGARRVFEHVYANPHRRYADLAAELGLSVQRVKQIVCEVRKTLRRALLEGDS